MDSNPGGPPPLQFDTAVPSVAPSGVITAQGVTCTVCQRAISDEYFDVNGQSVCDGCRTQLAQLAQTPRSWGLFVKAGVFGLVAAILGAILYYAVIAITDFEIGIVAIAIGYMVGWAIRKATANRGGRRYQVLALLLTYWAVGLAYTPITFQQLAKEDTKEQGQTATDTAAPASAESPDEARAINIPVVLAILLGFSVVLPVLVVFGSLPGGLLSALIIGIGMRQAWQMTGVPTLQISGPYRIATAASSTGV
jgi:Flp pilus assembly protein TadB